MTRFSLVQPSYQYTLSPPIITMRNQVRAFIAVELSQEVRSNVAKLIRSLQPVIDGTKWVETQNLHVTLKFLGDVPMNELHRLIAAMQRGANQMNAFDLAFHGCGAFPNFESPKTIWVGCEQGTKELAQLAGFLEDALFELGYAREKRRFSPHLTIGRVKKDQPCQLIPNLLEKWRDHYFGTCDIGEIVLYSSELTRRGPIYDVLGSAALG